MIRKFFTDSGFNFIAQIVAMVFGIACSVVTARVLGVNDFGVAAIVLLLPLTTQALLGSGLAPTVIYMTASNKWTRKSVIASMLGLWVFMSLGMILAATAFAIVGQSLFRGASLDMLLASLVIVPLTLLDTGLTAVLKANRLFKWLVGKSIIVWPIRFLNILIFVWLLELGVWGVVVSAIVSGFVMVAVGIGLIHRTKIYNENSWAPEFRFRFLAPALSYGARAGMGNVVGFLNYRADQFIVSGLLGPVGLGIYSVAVSLAEKLWVVANNLGAVLLPLVSSDETSFGRTEKFVAKVALSVMALMLMAATVLALLCEPIVLFLYKAEFADSAQVLIYLLPGIVLGGPSKLFANYVAGKGHPEYNAIRGGLALCANIALNFALIPSWGILGAAIATSISYGLSAIASAFIFYRMSGCSLRQLVFPTKDELRSTFNLFNRKLLTMKSRIED